MTAQATQNTVVQAAGQAVRVKLPFAFMARIANRMIERRQQRVLREMPEHLRRAIVTEGAADRTF